MQTAEMGQKQGHDRFSFCLPRKKSIRSTCQLSSNKNDVTTRGKAQGVDAESIGPRTQGGGNLSPLPPSPSGMVSGRLLSLSGLFPHLQ